MPLHPQSQMVTDLFAAARQVPYDEMSAPDAREAYKATNIPSTEVVYEIRDVDADGVPCRLYRPSANTNIGLLVYYHGGGWVIGDLDTHDGICRSLANKSGHAVLAVEYRLAPEHKFPAAVDDSITALKWAHNNAMKLGIDSNRIAVGGDSAGGNLAAVVAQQQVVPLKFQMLIYPCVDASMSFPSIIENVNGPLLTSSLMSWFHHNYLRDKNDVQNLKASPMLASDDVLKQMPPALVVTAQFDPLRDEGEAYGKRLVENGVNTTITRFNGQFHAFFSMLEILDDAEVAHWQAASLLRKYLA